MNDRWTLARLLGPVVAIAAVGCFSSSSEGFEQDGDEGTTSEVGADVDLDAVPDDGTGPDDVSVPSESDGEGDAETAPDEGDEDAVREEAEGSGDADGEEGDDTGPSDLDGDTILDDDEGFGDADGDSIPNARDRDSDGDGIPDSTEAGDTDPWTPPVDSDGDTVPDYLDTDSDDDWISDADEWILVEDTDLDGVPDYLDTDSDDDGIPDRDEAGDTDLATPPNACDGDALPNFRDTDSDNDGLLDTAEVLIHHTDPCLFDSDGDGVGDALEVAIGGDPLDSSCRPLADAVSLIFLDPPGSPEPPWVTIGAYEPATAESVAVDVAILDDPLDGRDVVSDFVERLQRGDGTFYESAGVCGPATARTCTPGLAIEDTDGDTWTDRFPTVAPGESPCVRVVPRAGASVTRTGEIQAWGSTVRFSVEGRTVAERRVYFLLLY